MISGGPQVAANFDCGIQPVNRRQTKVKAASPHDRFVIACHSPDGVVETRMLVCPPEKRRESLPAALSRTLSPVRFESKTCGIAAIFCDCQGNAGRFLRTSDCLVALPGIASRHVPDFPIMMRKSVSVKGFGEKLQI